MARSKIAGNAKIILSLDDKIAGGLRKVQARLNAFSKPLLSVGKIATGIGSSITGTLLGASLLFAKTGSDLNDMSRRTGIGVESLSELGYAFKQTGTDLSVLEKAAREMQAKGIDPNRFDEYADSIAGIEDPVTQAQAAMDLWGKRIGTKLLPVLEELPELRKKAKEFALTMSEEDAAAADELGDSLDTTWMQLNKVVETIGSAIAGPLTNFLDWTHGIVAAGINWIRNNKEIVQIVAMVAGGIFAVGSIFLATGVALSIAAVAAGGFASLIGVVGSVLSFLLSPVGLVIAAITSLATWFAVSTEYGRVLVANLTSWFSELATTIADTFGGIADALAGGDIAAAANVLWAGLKLLWQQGTHSLEQMWIGFKDSTLGIMTEIVFDVQALWTELASTMKGIWSGLVTESKSIGEQIGHWLSRSADPVLAAEQDAAHDNALSNIQREGAREQDQIKNEKANRLDEIESARKVAQDQRGRQFQSQLAASEEELAIAKEELAKELAEVDTKHGGKARKKMEEAELAFSGLGDFGSSSTKPQAILDATFAAQQFGGKSKELEVMESMDRSLKNIDKKNKKTTPTYI